MFRKAAIVLALTLVVGSLSAARAEDPDENFVAHWQAAARHWQAAMRHHGVSFSGPVLPYFAN
jgi:hypothetical protein